MTLVAVYDPSELALKSFAEQCQTGYRVAHSSDSVFSDATIDAVIVATPHSMLAEHAISTVQSGKHCLVEKPGGIRRSEIQSLVGVANRVGTTVRVGFNHRFHPSITLVKRLLEEGTMGQLMHVRGVYGHGGRRGYEREWRADRSISGGGELVDQGSHLIDLVHHLFGVSRLEYSSLHTSFWKMEVEDNAFLALRLRDNALAWLHASWTEWKNLFRLEMSFEFARIDINGLGRSYGTEQLTLHKMSPDMGPPETSIWSFPEPDHSWSFELQDFYRAVKGEPDNCATLEDALATWGVVEGAYTR
jgi:predicted dehydrogenase